MTMIMISYNILQKRLIFQKYKKMFSRKIHPVAIRSGSIRWISIRFDAEKRERNFFLFDSLYEMVEYGFICLSFVCIKYIRLKRLNQRTSNST